MGAHRGTSIRRMSLSETNFAFSGSSRFPRRCASKPQTRGGSSGRLAPFYGQSSYVNRCRIKLGNNGLRRCVTTVWLGSNRVVLNTGHPWLIAIHLATVRSYNGAEKRGFYGRFFTLTTVARVVGSKFEPWAADSQLLLTTGVTHLATAARKGRETEPSSRNHHFGRNVNFIPTKMEGITPNFHLDKLTWFFLQILEGPCLIGSFLKDSSSSVCEASQVFPHKVCEKDEAPTTSEGKSSSSPPHPIPTPGHTISATLLLYVSRDGAIISKSYSGLCACARWEQAPAIPLPRCCQMLEAPEPAHNSPMALAPSLHRPSPPQTPGLAHGPPHCPTLLPSPQAASGPQRPATLQGDFCTPMLACPPPPGYSTGRSSTCDRPFVSLTTVAASLRSKFRRSASDLYLQRPPYILKQRPPNGRNTGLGSQLDEAVGMASGFKPLLPGTGKFGVAYLAGSLLGGNSLGGGAKKNLIYATLGLKAGFGDDRRNVGRRGMPLDSYTHTHVHRGIKCKKRIRGCAISLSCFFELGRDCPLRKQAGEFVLLIPWQVGSSCQRWIRRKTWSRKRDLKAIRRVGWPKGNRRPLGGGGSREGEILNGREEGRKEGRKRNEEGRKKREIDKEGKRMDGRKEGRKE
ncbi:Potassium/sodium hyperpolarization-activated cyclic nucleotide-gated channel 4 [Ophiophagus hannah]|uniref:Potassium/sodium hyperpolarization-activated cyclic nucleotide-gated channel 4 n=1 Tax=Ophiophagus hannah TaxID=8665 RepID=V8NFJ9_OPHHA|nr:Potassium/sodium hyperpolarization-activated cyclic nucleotide-gated channel 4 [Ophiophagus hannah]